LVFVLARKNDCACFARAYGTATQHGVCTRNPADKEALFKRAKYAAGCELRRKSRFAHIKGFTYYGLMNITLSIDDDLVKEARKIAVERDTTLTGLVRSYLQQLAAEHAKSGRKRRELEALERSFEQLQIRMGKRTWKREDLYERS
jgi:uncharacterized protein DUF6364